jgi:hypothetical protein
LSLVPTRDLGDQKDLSIRDVSGKQARTASPAEQDRVDAERQWESGRPIRPLTPLTLEANHNLAPPVLTL